MASEFVVRNGLLALDNSVISGSLTVTGGITGSFSGTGSYAAFALSSSNSLTSSFAFQAANAASASFATSAATATTASHAVNAVTASFATVAANASSASFASNASIAASASFASNASTAASASFATNAANATTASHAVNAVTSSFATFASTAASASFASNTATAASASFATNASTAASASFATNAASATTASHALNAVTASHALNAVTASHALNAVTASYIQLAASASNALSASYALNASNATSASYSNFAITSSFASNAANASSASFAAFASTASNAQTLAPGTTVSASNVFVSNNLTVNGTASFGYLQTVSGSAVVIGEEYIVLNTQAPAGRFAGLLIYDSGSNSTASVVWDSERNHFVYTNASGAGYTGGGFISGPRHTGSLGSEPYPTQYRVVRGQGGDHIYDSNITDNDTNIILGINTQITGTLGVTGTITGNLTGTASFATSASYAGAASNATSASFATSAANATTASHAVNAVTASRALNANTASYATFAATATSATSANTASWATNVNTASWANNVVTASRALNANTASYAVFAATATSATSATTATSASHATFAATASTGDTFVVRNNIGVGISPSYPIHVKTATIYHITAEQSSSNVADTNAYATFYVLNNATASGNIRGYFGAGGSGVGNTNMQNHIYVGAQSNHGLRFFTNDSAKMTIETGGNVGIGTTTPISDLHVYDNSDVWHTRIGGASGELRIGGQTNSGAVIQAYTPAGVVRDLYIQRDGGNVGINTSSPTQLVEAYRSSNSDVVYQITNPNTGTAATAQFFASNGTTRTQFFHTGTSYVGTGILNAAGLGGIYNQTTAGIALAASNAAGAIKFSTGTSNTEVMRITGSNVGINISTPSNLLHLAGASATPSLRLGSISVGYHWDIGRENLTTGDFVFNNANGGSSTEKVRITVAGNVGINSTAPEAKLTVAGYTLLKTDTNEAHSWFPYTDGSVYISCTTGSNIIFRSYHPGFQSTFGLFNSSGNLGVGTSTVNYKLHVTGDAFLQTAKVKFIGGTNYNENIRISSQSNGYASIVIGAPEGTNIGAAVGQWAFVRYPQTTDDFKFTIRHNATDVMTFSTGSNVGIGTTTPAQKLDVVGNIGINGRLFAFNSATYTQITDPAGGIKLYLGASGDPGNYYDNTSHNFRSIGGSTTYVTINSNGNVGIGTTSPSYKLEISSGNGTFVKFGDNGYLGQYSNAAYLMGGGQFNSSGTWTARSTEAAAVGVNETGEIGFFTNSGLTIGNTYSPTTRMRITSGGSVGIGTTSPQNSLHVYGSIRAGIANTSALIVSASAGNQTMSASIAIQQLTSEGDTIIFADYEPYAEWGIVAKNNDNAIDFNSGNSGGNLTSYLIKNRTGDLRTAYVKTRIDLDNGDLYTGGSVGIGTSIPGAKVEVYNGDIWLNAASEAVNPEIRFIDGGGIGVAGLKIRYGNNDGNAYFEHMYDTATSGFFFRNRVTGTTLNTLSLVNGNVGINTTAPTYALEVDKSVTAAAILGIQNTSNSGYSGIHFISASGTLVGHIGYGNTGTSAWTDQFFMGSIASKTLVLTVGDSGRVYINTSGNVGIGTTGPLTLLHVRGTGTSSGVVARFSSTSPSGSIELGHSGNGGFIGYANIGAGNAANTFYITTGAGTIGSGIIVNNGGSVGIGTTIPVAKLSIFSTSPHGSPTGISVAAGSGGANLIARDTSYHNWLPYTDGNNYYSANSHIFRNETHTTDWVTINSNGSVGIGTTAPQAVLHAYKSSDAYAIIQAGGGSYSYLRLQTPSSGNGYIIKNLGTVNSVLDKSLYLWNDPGPIQFVTDGTPANAMTISGSGNLGIGTSTPSVKLEVNGTSYIGKMSAYAPAVHIRGAYYGGPRLQVYGLDADANAWMGLGTDMSAGAYELSIYYPTNANSRVTFGKYNGSTTQYSGFTTTAKLDNGGTWTVLGDVVAYGSPSDISLKTNIKPLENSLDKILKLNGVSFEWKKEADARDLTGIKDDLGFIAQEVQEVLPDLVRKNDNGLLSLRDKGIIPVLVEAIKEQQKQIDELKYLLQTQNK